MNQITQDIIALLAYAGTFTVGVLLTAFFHKRREQYLTELAQKYNFKYLKGQQIDLMRSFKSRIFKYSRTIKTEGVFEGTHKDHVISIFTKSFYPGRYLAFSQRRDFTIGSCEFGKTDFPHILLQSKNMPLYQPTEKTDRKISIEPEYLKDFNLHCPEDYEIEVLQIFTEELLHTIQNISNKFSIEFGGNRLYVYIDKDAQNKRNESYLGDIINIIKGIIDKTDGLLHRLEDDFEVLHEHYRK